MNQFDGLIEIAAQLFGVDADDIPNVMCRTRSAMWARFAIAIIMSDADQTNEAITGTLGYSHPNNAYHIIRSARLLERKNRSFDSQLTELKDKWARSSLCAEQN